MNIEYFENKTVKIVETEEAWGERFKTFRIYRKTKNKWVFDTWLIEYSCKEAYEKWSNTEGG